jgi:hypothetical protein
LIGGLKVDENGKKKAIPGIIKYTFIIALVAILIALFLAVYQSNYEAMKKIGITNEFKEAYSVSANIRTHAVDDEFSGNGGFYGYAFYYIEDAGYVQFCVKYNTNQIAKLKDKYPALDGIEFVIRDSKGNEYKPAVIGREAKFHYVYLKLEYRFENGEFDFAKDELIARMIIKGVDHDFDSEGFNDLVIHRAGEASIQYELTKKEQKQLN